MEGSTRYSEEEIIAASEIEEGQNMFLFNKFTVIDRLLAQFAYVDSVSIRRVWPSTIRIAVTECDVAAALYNEDAGEWWYINSSGKLMERGVSVADYPTVSGLSLAAPSVGTTLAVTEDDRLKKEALLGVLSAMETQGLLEQLQSIDLSSASMLVMEYAGRLTVKLNLNADYDYEIRVLATVMEEYVNEKWDADDTGTLDRTQDDGQTHLIRD